MHFRKDMAGSWRDGTKKLQIWANKAATLEEDGVVRYMNEVVKVHRSRAPMKVRLLPGETYFECHLPPFLRFEIRDQENQHRWFDVGDGTWKAKRLPAYLTAPLIDFVGKILQ